MSRNSKKVFSKTHTTKARRESIDYDYINKLDSATKDWLAQFTEEYYSASFNKNAGYIKKEELIPILEREISKAGSEKGILKWQKHLERVSSVTSKYVQVSENELSSHDIDLRKCRKVDIFYINERGNYVKSKKYKYSSDNIINPNNDEDLKDCNDRANAQRSCVLNSFTAIDSEYLDKEEMTEFMSPEDYFLLNEDVYNYAMEEGENLIENDLE